MIHIQYFIKALKMSWFRRDFQNSKISLWCSLSNIEFGTLFNMGPGYPLQINENMTNPFWKEILRHWKEFCDLVNVETMSDFKLPSMV